MEEDKLQELENSVQENILIRRREQWNSPSVVTVLKSKRLISDGHVACMSKARNLY
jgi:hypothetical protein